MTDAVVECVRVRGPHAARLARVAATDLPDALDRALAGLPSARVDQVKIRLDLDIAGNDDATIAAIWASQVRAEVERKLPAGARASGTLEEMKGTAPPASVSLPDAVAAAREWLARAQPRGPVPVAALAQADALLAGARGGTVTSAQFDLLVALDIAIARDRRHVSAAPSASQPEGSVPKPATPTSTAVPAPFETGKPPLPGRTRYTGSESSPDHSGLTGEAAAESDVAEAMERIGTLAELVGASGERAGALDPTAITDAAGLALLYPWLADHCRAAVSLHPGLDECEVRAHALAALVDPDDLGLAGDPLVRLLAGAPARSSAGRIRLPHSDAVAAGADRVLQGFASLLPGFASSSPPFVRSEWIARAGLVEDHLDPARLTAATHPLDVVLIRLPYPVSLFKLPWSPPVAVRFRP